MEVHVAERFDTTHRDINELQPGSDHCQRTAASQHTATVAYCLEDAELLIAHRAWPHRADFTRRFVASSPLAAGSSTGSRLPTGVSIHGSGH